MKMINRLTICHIGARCRKRFPSAADIQVGYVATSRISPGYHRSVSSGRWLASCGAARCINIKRQRRNGSSSSSSSSNLNWCPGKPSATGIGQNRFPQSWTWVHFPNPIQSINT